ncbi:2605_t:CDS:2, partial [Ambispora leptoticha]
LEQERLANQAKLIEEEKQKKLAAIALEDKEQRQRIEKQANEEKAQSQKIELERLIKERELQTKMAQELNRLAAEQTRILRENKNSADQMRAYPSSESQAGTQNPTQSSGGTLRS